MIVMHALFAGPAIYEYPLVNPKGADKPIPNAKMLFGGGNIVVLEADHQGMTKSSTWFSKALRGLRGQQVAAGALGGKVTGNEATMPSHNQVAVQTGNETPQWA